jgi:hypothetical protein
MRTGLAGVVGTLLLAGCVSVTSPVLAGKDTYMMGLGARGGFSSDAELLAQTIQAAGAFCTSQHRTIEVVSSTSSGVQMWTPQSNQVMFKCLPLDGAAEAPKPVSN